MSKYPSCHDRVCPYCNGCPYQEEQSMDKFYIGIVAKNDGHLHMGLTSGRKSSFEEAKAWGEKYIQDNPQIQEVVLLSSSFVLKRTLSPVECFPTNHATSVPLKTVGPIVFDLGDYQVY